MGLAEYLEVKGGTALSGEVRVGGAKNAALPIIISTLLTKDQCTIENVPQLKDVQLTLNLMELFGAQVDYFAEKLTVCTPEIVEGQASYSLVKALRASFWVLAPLLARTGRAEVALPGGDLIGARPVDLHLAALTQMGADIKVKNGLVVASAPDGLRPADIHLSFPSVGATHQILMAASLVPGETVISGAAREPEVVQLAQFLTGMGAQIDGAGEDRIRIRGRAELGGANLTLIGDRIEAATFVLALLMTLGRGRVSGFDPLHLGSLPSILSDMGATLKIGRDYVDVDSNDRRPRPVSCKTEPFPGLATDMQAILMACLCIADGESTVEESVFDGRFSHVAELCRMGADIRVRDRTATIIGVERLSAAPIEALDLRAGAALVLAALSAEGISKVLEVHHVRRGYSNFEEKLKGLGAQIGGRITDPEDYLFTGC